MDGQLEFNFDVDPIVYDIENVTGEIVEQYRPYNTFVSGDVTVQYYYALTAIAIFDLSISNDSHYNTIFARYDRQQLEGGDRTFARSSPIIERIFSKEALG